MISPPSSTGFRKFVQTAWRPTCEGNKSDRQVGGSEAEGFGRLAIAHPNLALQGYNGFRRGSHTKLARDDPLIFGTKRTLSAKP